MTQLKTLNDLEFPEQYYEQTNKEMIREAAKNWIRTILSGEEFSEELEIPNEIKQKSREHIKKSKKFNLGVRYGMYAALMMFCDLKTEDLINDEN